MNHRELIKELLTLSDEALKGIKKGGLAKNREVAKEYVLGGEVQIRYPAGAEWFDVDVTSQFNSDYQYRIKPRTININGYEVPEPIYRIKEKTEVWCMDYECKPTRYDYNPNIPSQKLRISAGVCFKSKEDCQKYIDAILSFTKEKS